MHSILRRQLRKLGLNTFDEVDAQGWQKFLQQISQTYEQADRDRYTIERSLQISSDEMQELYQSLQQSLGSALSQERNKLSAIINSMGSGLVMFDEHNKVSMLNQQAADLLNGNMDEITGTSLADIIQPEDEITINCIDQARTLCERNASYECSAVNLLRVDGTKFPASLVLAPVESDGNFHGIVMLFRDITQLQEREERLKLTSLVFNNTSNAVIITDAEGAIQVVNRAFTTITGYSEDESHGQNIEELLNVDSGKDTLRSARRILSREQSWEGDLNLNKKSNTPFQAWATMVVVNNDKGEPSQHLTIFTDISILQQSTEQLHHLAHHDPLTGLPNRLLFHKALMKSLEDSTNSNRKLAILFLDLDRFKNINDSMGHPVGDELLQTIALRLQNLIGNRYVVSRFGGDEFVILMDRIHSESDAAALAERITKELERPVLIGNTETFITTSIGISTYPQHGRDSNELIRNADAAMYFAKESGRNNYQFYYEELTARAAENLKLEGSMRYALENNELLLHFQPQIELGTNRITGFEALLRWDHPLQGMLYPNRFIDIAIETGLILPIGRWVLNEACRTIAAWNRPGISEVSISVNLATQQLIYGDIVRDVEQALETTMIDPELLELEITESALMQHEDRAITALKTIEEMGVKFAIDDFGTGYASLDYLKKFPVDRLKIDRSFIKNLTRDKTDKAIVRSIITLAHSLTIPVVAEGVENKAQLDTLNSMFCNEYQGFYYSRAVPMEDAQDMLIQSRGERP